MTDKPKYEERNTDAFQYEDDEGERIETKELPVALRDHHNGHRKWAKVQIENVVTKHGHQTKTLINVERSTWFMSQVVVAKKEVLIIPYIEANILYIGENMLSSARTIILNGNVNVLELNGLTTSDVTKNLWFYGTVHTFMSVGYPFHSVRLPNTVNTILCSNRVGNIIGLDQKLRRGDGSPSIEMV